MCSSHSTTVFLSPSSLIGNLCTARSTCCPAPLQAQTFITISFKANILQASDARSHIQSLGRAMRVANRSSRPGLTTSDRVFPGVLVPKCAASKGETSGDGGFQWRKRSVTPGLRQSSSPPSSSSSSSKKSQNGKESGKSSPPKGSAGGPRRQGKGASRPVGTFKGRTISADRVASSIPRSSSLDIGEGEGKDSSVNGSLEKRKKPPKIREQVRITSPISKDPKIAILGGGMSGLICALTLQEKGIRSTLFDTGKHGLGGRMGTRHVAQINGDQLAFDHAAQYFTATDPKFKKLVNQWMEEGAVREWKGVVGTLEMGGKFTELQSSMKYIATNGMRLFADHLVSKRELIDVVRPCWISRVKELDGRWHLSEYENRQGEFDIVIIAHNGKCANRLLGPIGVPLVAKQMKRLELSSIWALMAAFDQPLPTPISPSGNEQIEGAFVAGIDSLSWMGNNTAKLHASQNSWPYCWTFFSTAKYGKKNKVPQESIPTVRAARVKKEMLQGVEKALGLEEGSLPAPLYMKVQLWGAANPVNSPHVPCIFDAHGRVGICGDWLLGSNLEAAALSGMAMANHISAFCERKGLDPEEFSVGLEDVLLPVGGHDIGQFDGQEIAAKAADTQLLTAV
ncbi:hypothetical protein GOP47_0025135 [Adiantum capillus-veneris]|uniref:Uncharacterized protein n=1 Tax=Adiantum capillus-veneris TaxID=13818 RepID=A0A9D4U2G9_ADICA|nr:hypothetical protein GOP47_0024643 [Adiantum capillus-veneris]KAI5060715.1 hypothetical protein GOP47_0025135 [Adiantum capillus-veneris]